MKIFTFAAISTFAALSLCGLVLGQLVTSSMNGDRDTIIIGGNNNKKPKQHDSGHKTTYIPIPIPYPVHMGGGGHHHTSQIIPIHIPHGGYGGHGGYGSEGAYSHSDGYGGHMGGYSHLQPIYASMGYGGYGQSAMGGGYSPMAGYGMMSHAMPGHGTYGGYGY